MSVVFLSYDRDDGAKAKLLATALKKAGNAVWWDDLIKGGTQYTNEIEEALKTSDVVVAYALTRKWPEAAVQLVGVLAAFGRDEEIYRVMDRLKSRPDLYPEVREIIFQPSFESFWRNPRSMQVAAHLGFLDYWLKSGNWPDFCSRPPFRLQKRSKEGDPHSTLTERPYCPQWVQAGQ